MAGPILQPKRANEGEHFDGACLAGRLERALGRDLNAIGLCNPERGRMILSFAMDDGSTLRIDSSISGDVVITALDGSTTSGAH